MFFFGVMHWNLILNPTGVKLWDRQACRRFAWFWILIQERETFLNLLLVLRSLRSVVDEAGWPWVGPLLDLW